jgi:chromosomal replication initiation ATPase DnaA
MGEIQQRVAEHYGLQTADLRSGCKKPEVAAARAMAFMLCRKKGFSWASIGREFECHYTTAYKAQRKMANLAVRNADVKREFERLEK